MQMDEMAGEPLLRVAGDTTIAFKVTAWQPWFAWHPVRLYMSSRHAWLKPLWRRCVDKNGVECCDYTDTPEKFPDPGAVAPYPVAAA